MEPDSHGVADTRCLRDSGAVVDGAVLTSPLTGVLYRGVVILPDFFWHVARRLSPGGKKATRTASDVR